jgi:hypothetical protein
VKALLDLAIDAQNGSAGELDLPDPAAGKREEEEEEDGNGS